MTEAGPSLCLLSGSGRISAMECSRGLYQVDEIGDDGRVVAQLADDVTDYDT